MSSKEKPLGDIVYVQGGYAFKSKDFSDKGDIVLKIKNVRDGFVDYNEAACVSSIITNNLAQYKTENEDILISMTGSGPNAPASVVGRIARVKLNEPIAYINQRVGKLVLKKEGEISKRFLYYFLSQKSISEYLVSNSTGSANQANINPKLIESILIPELTYEESAEIASKLACLDDKIDNNNRINQTLEEIAQALFKSWFVDFEPVKAKMKAKAEGKDPHTAAMGAISGKTEEELHLMTQETYEELALTANLFPDNLVESELGLIPKGWGVKTIKDIAGHIKKSINPSKNEDTLYAHYSLPAFDSGRKPKLEYGVDIKSNKYNVGAKTILISKLNPTTPRIWDIIKPFQDNSICSTEFQVAKPKEDFLFEFASLVLKSQRVIKELSGKVTGTSKSHQRINPNDIFNTSIILPNEKVLKAFSLQTCSSFKLVDLNTKQNVSLSESRDTLLPKMLFEDFLKK